jgi:hypothetical protein
MLKTLQPLWPTPVHSDGETMTRDHAITRDSVDYRA